MSGAREDGEDLGARPRLLRLPILQRRAVDELHRDEDAVPERPRVVNGDDVGMRELGDRLGLAEQPDPRDGVRGALVRPQELEGDLAIELRVVGGVDLAHAAAPDHVEDGVAADAGSALQRSQLVGRRPDGSGDRLGPRSGDDASAQGGRRVEGEREEILTRGARDHVRLDVGDRIQGQASFGQRRDALFVEAGQERMMPEAGRPSQSLEPGA
jgi:hypothetical protein